MIFVGTENLISINVITALFTLINMILTFLILKKFLFKPMQKMMKQRQDDVDQMYADAEKAKADAEEMKTDYEEKLKDAKNASQQILKEAGQEAAKRQEEILQEAKAEAEALRAHAEREIGLEKKKALNDVKDDISRIAFEMAEKVVRKQLSGEEKKRLADEFIEGLGEKL